ncbi:MAG: N-acetyltransferase [Desulfobacterales bacterium]
MDIRNTIEADEPEIRRVHEAAFGPQAGRTVADLALALLHDPTASPFISLLACDGSASIGHVLFTSVRISGPGKSPEAFILAPLAVLPDRQRHGIGTKLVQAGLTVLSESGGQLVFVLGHPEYYPRFGFQPAGRLGLSAPYLIPEENANAWMVLELSHGILGSVRGKARCADALNNPEHWHE